MRRLSKLGRAKMVAMAILVGVAGVTVGGVVMPHPALAWWRNGVWIPGPPPVYRPPPRPYYGPGYAPRPYYYAPPVVVAPPPVYYAPPPVIYAAPPPPPVYYPPPTPAPAAPVARACYTPTISCPMEVPRAPGSTCYCSDSTGDRSYGNAQ